MILANLNAVELSTILPNCQRGNNNNNCTISTPYNEITNNVDFRIGGNDINIDANINTFINYGTITPTQQNSNQSIGLGSNGHISHFINYGTMIKMFWIANNSSGIDTLTNYGTMGGIQHEVANPLTLNNFGIMGVTYGSQGTQGNMNIEIRNNGKVLIQNYALKVDETATTFNNFRGLNNTTNFSHLVVNIQGNGSITFKDKNSKIILDFGNGFEFGKEYSISKVATDTSGDAYSGLSVDFSRLTTRNDIYTLTQSGEYFIAHLQPEHSAISNTSKANIRTMNNFLTMSNAMIFQRKSQSVGGANNLALDSTTMPDLVLSLKSHESFSYRNEAQNRRIQNRNYSRKLQRTKTAKSKNRRIQTKTTSQTPAHGDYHFILSPFVNYNSFAKSGNYNLSGFDYGFLSAFSIEVAESNALGAHFAFSYGDLGDAKDADLSIRTMNFMVGLNYKLDLNYGLYLKARGDFFYFLNELNSATWKSIKPDNLGFGATLTFGKDFDFKSGGVLGIELGADYKALQSNKVELNSQSYQKSLYNLIYADLGVNYAKYFGGFGINVGGGFRANLAPKLAESALIADSKTHKFILDNDKFLGYANAGIGYVLNAKNFDMEFSLAYYGNFGDRIISNGGGFEWRVFW